MIWVLFGSFLLLLLIGVPVVLSLGLGCVLAIIVEGNTTLMLVAQRVANAMDSFPLLAVPLFIVLGEVINKGTIGQRIVDFSESVVGSVKGGMAHANVLSSMFFGGISGSATADTAAIGSIMIPAMVKGKYGVEFSAVVTCTSSIIGVIIPPSVNMILYGWISGTSISALFAGGLIPGVMIGLGLMAVSYIVSVKKDYGVKVPFSLQRLRVSFVRALPVLVLPIIILGGIFLGIFTATESAAIAVVYGILLMILFYREARFRDLPRIFKSAIITFGSVLLIIAFASTFGWILTSQQVPQQISHFFITNLPSKNLFLLSTILISLIVGTFLTPASALIILTPILFPVSVGYGIPAVHYGLVLISSLSLGHVTPPVGLTLFLGASIAKVPITQLLKPLLPFFAVLLVAVALIAFVPGLTLLIPSLFG